LTWFGNTAGTWIQEADISFEVNEPDIDTSGEAPAEVADPRRIMAEYSVQLYDKVYYKNNKKRHIEITKRSRQI